MTAADPVAAGELAPRPGAAPLARMLRAQTGMELRLLVRNGEQLLLVVVIPTLLLILFTTVRLETLPGGRVSFLVPGVLALAVLSTAFTSQAIAVGFERRYGALKRLGATALPRSALLGAKTLALAAVEVAQLGLLCLVGWALGWSPHGNPAWVVGLLVLGTVAFSGLGLLMAGALRAEATLAAANLVYLLLLALGGVLFPVSRLPGALRVAVEGLPIAALSSGLRGVLQHGVGVPAGDWIVLACWAVTGLGLAAATFRWE